MESPPSPHAPLPFAPGTGLRSKLAVLGHGAGEPEVSRLPMLLCSLSPPFPIFLACNFKNLNSGEKQREYTNTQEKKTQKILEYFIGNCCMWKEKKPVKILMFKCTVHNRLEA